jgi:hypothetical protein
MRVATVLAIVGVLLVGFGWWGVQTVAGRRAFDEMAGMIPLGAGAFGALLLVAALVLSLVRR